MEAPLLIFWKLMRTRMIAIFWKFFGISSMFWKLIGFKLLILKSELTKMCLPLTCVCCRVSVNTHLYLFQVVKKLIFFQFLKFFHFFQFLKFSRSKIFKVSKFQKLKKKCLNQIFRNFSLKPPPVFENLEFLVPVLKKISTRIQDWSGMD